MKKENAYMTIGILLCIASLIAFARNIRVAGWSFYHMGNINVGGILTVLLIGTVIWLMVKPSKAAKITLMVISVLFIISIILGVRTYLTGMTFFKFLAMVLSLAAGIGFIIKGKMEKSS